MLPDDLYNKLRAADEFSHFQFTCDALGNTGYRGFDTYLAVAQNAVSGFDGKNDFELLEEMQQIHTWLFGYLGYDLKNQVEKLQSLNTDPVGFPDIHFFVPEYLLHHAGDEWKSIIGNADEFANVIPSRKAEEPLKAKMEISLATSRVEYIETVKQIRELILEGEVYEMNYCIELAAEQVQLDPIEVFMQLVTEAQMPFSTLLKVQDRYLICASPERFMKKEGQRVMTQPIKGTTRRGQDAAEDEVLKKELLASDKERAENIMIVDLVRNDLNRSCRTGTVKVEELLGVYTFKRLHHLISTVAGELRPDVTGIQAIKHAFPMGSMTGAPKVRAMQLIEELENRKRGLFSGAVGYFSPGGDFDFNVVIRSIFYNKVNQHLSLKIGSAITYDSDPESEYEECKLKAASMLAVLGASN